MQKTRPVSRILCLAASLLPAMAVAADPVSYKVNVQPTGESELDAALAGSSQLVALRSRAPAGPFALVARARADQGRLHAALDSFGYYQARVSITVAGRMSDDAGLPDVLAAMPAGQAADVGVQIDRGPLFHLRRVTLEGSLPPEARRRFTLSPGDPAVAARVLGAGGALAAALQEGGYALARVDASVAREIPAEHALDVTFHVVSGPRVDIGPIGVTGLQRVHELYVRRRLLIRPGDLYQPSRIEAAREDLASTGVFSGVKISAASALGLDGRIPLRVDVSERKLHAVTFNVAYSTDLGGSAGVTWTHRDLFGNAEQLNLSASVTGLGGSADRGIGYEARVQFLKPDYTHRDQTLELDLTALKQDLDSYNQTAEIAGAVLSRKLSKRWTVSGGLTAEQETILQEGVTRDYTLVAVPFTARFDSTDVPNPLADPTHGLRAALLATPTQSLGRQGSTFVVLQGTASTYVDLGRLGVGRPGSSVLAFRGLVGSAQGATDFQLPPDQRFYGGGSSTVRGYKYQTIGPLFADGNPIGGAAIDAATIELRQRVWGNIAAALFADAGQVNASSAPFQGKLQEGVGAGLRYYTPIGPIRVDVAVPTARPPSGDSFELYLGLGQAF